jgi:NADH-quinone oxidoreductase subunit H
LAPRRGRASPTFNHSLLYSLALSSLSVYAITLAGWASNNKYSLMGAMRSSAQMVSYELPMGLAVVSLFMVTQNMSLRQMAEIQHLQGWNILAAATGRRRCRCLSLLASS